ncbi:putative defense protein 3 [Dendronephthya gigantea]|uniref:putative defense protein 3 n=1 Tax=Dendronephthya gigantea TaxID=151771 RepID=UPI001068DB1B|nr:putative defense protein 3 [Dendronephthya gigantea]
MKYLIIIATIFAQLLVIQEAHGYPNGAPKSTCSNLTPGHGKKLSGDHPFNLTVQIMKSSHEIEVMITPKENTTIFQGFILQARKIGDTKPVGEFVAVPDNTKAVECDHGNDTATHSNTANKASLTFRWISPVPFDASIQFHTTIAIKKDSYWKGIVSSEVPILALDSKALPSAVTSSTLMFITFVFVCQLFM